MPGLIPSSRLGKPGRKGLLPSRGCSEGSEEQEIPCMLALDLSVRGVVPDTTNTCPEYCNSYVNGDAVLFPGILGLQNTCFRFIVQGWQYDDCTVLMGGYSGVSCPEYNPQNIVCEFYYGKPALAPYDQYVAYLILRGSGSFIGLAFKKTSASPITLPLVFTFDDFTEDCSFPLDSYPNGQIGGGTNFFRPNDDDCDFRNVTVTIDLH